MADDIKKNVFISHIHEDDAGLGKLKSLLAKAGMVIRDSSITSEKPNNAKDPEYIKNKLLAPRIDWAGTLLVYVSPDTRDSAYVNWEIEYAAKHDKRIVGVWENGAKECELPEALKEYADAVVGWNGNSIVDAINGNKTGAEHPDGTPFPDLPLKRHPC